MNDTIKEIITPILKESGKAITMDFPSAIREITNGKKVRRVSWPTESDHGLLKDGWLIIHTKGAYHKWLVNDGDLEGEDYIIVK